MGMPRFATVIAALAGGPGCPAGDPGVTLELLVPLTADAQIDPSGYAVAADYCRARLLRAGREDWSLRFARVEAGWALRAAEDEPLWLFDARLLRPGAYLTLRRPDGAEFIFRVVNVERPEPA